MLGWLIRVCLCGWRGGPYQGATNRQTMTATLTNGMLDGATHTVVEAIGLTKRFRFPAGGRHTTIKDAVLQRVRYDGHFGVVEALHDVTFSLNRGQSLGVIGENGSGKTTLLRVLAGIIKPDSGQVRLGGSVAPLLATGAGFNPVSYGPRKRACRNADARPEPR